MMSWPQVTALWSFYLCGLVHQKDARCHVEIPATFQGSCLTPSCSSLASDFLEVLSLPWAGSPSPGLFSWHPQLRTAAPLPPDCEACSPDAPEWRCSLEASWDALAVVLASSF